MTRTRTPQRARFEPTEIAALYDRISPIYDIWGRLMESKALDRALDFAGVTPGEHILEVAVGTGLGFVRLVRANPTGRNVGIDISPGMLSRAERRLRGATLDNYELSLGSASALPEDDRSFDLLVNSYMFDLMAESEWPRVLDEFHRVLKPEGRFVMANMTHGEKRGTGLYERLYRVWPSIMGGCRGIQMADLIEASGFEVRRREYVQQLLFPSEVILASRRAD